MRRFEKYADFIYGKPDPHIFNNVIQTIERDVERSLQTSDTVSPAQREAKTRLLQTISEYKIFIPTLTSMHRHQFLKKLRK
jgi:hypothetical protein